MANVVASFIFDVLCFVVCFVVIYLDVDFRVEGSVCE